MEELISLSLPSIAALSVIAAFYFNTRNAVSNLKAEIKSVKERSDEKDNDVKLRIDLLEKVVEKKANNNTMLAIKDELKGGIDDLRLDIKELNKNLLKLLSKNTN